MCGAKEIIYSGATGCYLRSHASKIKFQEEYTPDTTSDTNMTLENGTLIENVENQENVNSIFLILTIQNNNDEVDLSNLGKILVMAF